MIDEVPRQVFVDGNVIGGNVNDLNFIVAESFDDGISISSLIDETDEVEDALSIPSIVKDRNENMSISTTEDEFEDEEDTTIAAPASEGKDDYDMTDFYDMDCGDLSLPGGLADESQDLSYNVTDVTCPLCLYTVDGGEAIVLPDCKHSVCIPCFQDHIKSRSKLSKPVCCPLQYSAECSTRSLSRSLIGQINAMEFIPEGGGKESMGATRSSVYHPCPTLGCTNIVYWKEGNGPPIGDCFRCNQTCCLKCGTTPYHHNKTCQEYQTYLSSASSSNEPSIIVAPLHVIEERGDRNTRRCSL